MDLDNRAVIPPHSAPEQLIHSSADKIDDCTLDGKHTLHATRYTTWQRGPSHVVTLKNMTPANQATFAVLRVMNTIFHSSEIGVTTELQFENAIRVEWFDKTLSESYLGLKAQSIDHSIFIQQGGHSRT